VNPRRRRNQKRARRNRAVLSAAVATRRLFLSPGQRLVWQGIADEIVREVREGNELEAARIVTAFLPSS
jgi:hypothetical protein